MQDQQDGTWQGGVQITAYRLRRAAALLGAAALLLGVQSTAHAAEKRFGLTQFHSIEILTDAYVEIIHRGPISAVATGSVDALDRLVMEARDGRLRISSRQLAGDSQRRRAAEPLRIQINAQSVRELQLLGSGYAKMDQLRGQRMRLSLRGTGQIEVGGIAGEQLSIEMLGQGQMRLAGQAKQAAIRLSGDNGLAGADLRVLEAEVEANGAGAHQLSVIKNAKISLRGTGRVEILGEPACTVRSMGLGTVICGK